MKMDQVLPDSISKRTFAEEDHSIERFVLDAFHESFHIGIHVRTSWCDLHALNVDVGQDLAELFTETCVVVHDQVSLSGQESILAIGQERKRVKERKRVRSL